MATVFFPNGNYDPFPLPTGTTKLLAALRMAVGGNLEVVSLSGGRKMVVNEEGIALGLRCNERATEIAGCDLNEGDYIKGSAVLCAPGEFDMADGGGARKTRSKKTR